MFRGGGAPSGCPASLTMGSIVHYRACTHYSHGPWVMYDALAWKSVRCGRWHAGAQYGIQPILRFFVVRAGVGQRRYPATYSVQPAGRTCHEIVMVEGSIRPETRQSASNVFSSTAEQPAGGSQKTQHSEAFLTGARRTDIARLPSASWGMHDLVTTPNDRSLRLRVCSPIVLSDLCDRPQPCPSCS
jgi:hypothetical protein